MKEGCVVRNVSRLGVHNSVTECIHTRMSPCRNMCMHKCVHAWACAVLQESVVVLGYPTGGDQLSITEGVVSRVGVSMYAHSYFGYAFAIFQLNSKPLCEVAAP